MKPYIELTIENLQLQSIITPQIDNYGTFSLQENNRPTCMHHGDVRLVGGDTSYDGRVEICLSNSWVQVCDSHDWNVLDSTVVCRQLTGMQNPCKK